MRWRSLLVTWLVCVASAGCARPREAEHARPPDAARQHRYIESRDAALRQALAVRGLRVEYRWVVSDSAGSQSPYSDPDTHCGVLLSPTPLITLDGIDRVDLYGDTTSATVIAHLTFDAAQKVLSRTQDSTAHRLAALINGRIVAIGMLGSAMVNMLPLASEVSLPQAQALVARVSVLRPPITRASHGPPLGAAPPN